MRIALNVAVLDMLLISSFSMLSTYLEGCSIF